MVTSHQELEPWSLAVSQLLSVSPSARHNQRVNELGDHDLGKEHLAAAGAEVSSRHTHVGEVLAAPALVDLEGLKRRHDVAHAHAVLLAPARIGIKYQ